MAFENWNRLVEEYKKQRANKQPPPQNKNDSKEVSEIEQKQIQKVSR